MNESRKVALIILLAFFVACGFAVTEIVWDTATPEEAGRE